ncbi:MAG: hypothetical protein CMJ18_13435 [Phycisphaeraceae bacterium]|nr:hypothetical protein [Phycisphaeraceae bacterium]
MSMHAPRRSVGTGLTHRTGVIVALLAVFVAAAAARGQNALGDGRALDRNLQVGSGGINAAAPVVDYAARNNIVTGNVIGLSYFRDDIGYAAPNEFRDVTSSVDLFRFRAISEPPRRPVNTGRHFWAASEYNSYYTPFATPRIPVTTRRGAIDPLAQPSFGGLYGFYDHTRSNYGSPSSAATTVYRTFDESGRIMESTAAPLMGIQHRALDVRRSLGLYDVLGEDDEAPAAAEEPGAEESEDGESKDGAIDNRVDSNQLIGRPSIALGTHLDEQLYRLSDPGASARDEMGRIQETIFRALDVRDDLTAEDDVYLNLLGLIKGQSPTATGREEPGQGEDAGTEPAAGGDPPAIPDPAAVPDPLTAIPDVLKLEPPTAEQMARARDLRREAMRRRITFDPQTDGVVEPAQLESAIDPAARAGITDPIDPIRDNQDLTTILAQDEPKRPAFEEDVEAMLDGVLESLDYQLPDVKTLAGKRASRINKLLSEAEADIREGRYFDAEENYRLILIGEPRHPMARVGMIHAQLGAGMINSASMSLRSLFENHPEMIAARYDAQLLPRQQRLEWVRDRIMKMLELTDRSDPALLLAYLGYQVRQSDLVTYGLDQAQTRNPLDPLIVLLRRIWIDKAEQDGEAPGKSQ